MRYVSSYLEKSGWSLPFGVVSSLVAWRSPTRLEAPDLLSLGDGLLGHSTIQVCIGFFGVPTDVAFKVCRFFGRSFVKLGIGFKLQLWRSSLRETALRAATPVAGVEDDWESLTRT